jgi:8-oxo-dGTP pyrophosphatase MutT (NUDIX family)
MTAPLRPQSAERPALQKFRTALNALYLEVEPSIANDIVDLANAALVEAEAYARAAAAESRKHNWKCVAPENGYYRWQCQNPGCSETAPYPSVLPDSSCAYSAALPVGESPAAAPKTRPKIICLCGSTRFYEYFQRANYDETMLGNIVLSVGFYPHAQKEMHHEDAGCTPEQKIALDELHKRKIDLADEVLVLNVGGYIGSSTRSEIDYAEVHGKPVRYLETELGVGESPAAAPQHEHRIYTSAVIRRGEKFLCIHHDSLGVWLFPGGKPKNGEPFLDCLIRECREELGITITSASFREAFINTVKGRQWAGLFYDVDEFEGEPHILEPQNHSALEWLSFDEMQQRATNQPEMGIASFCRAAAPAAPLPCHTCGTILDPNWLNCPKCEGKARSTPVEKSTLDTTTNEV